MKTIALLAITAALLASPSLSEQPNPAPYRCGFGTTTGATSHTCCREAMEAFSDLQHVHVSHRTAPFVQLTFTEVESQDDTYVVVHALIGLPLPDSPAAATIPNAERYLDIVYKQDFQGQLSDLSPLCSEIADSLHRELTNPAVLNRVIQ